MAHPTERTYRTAGAELFGSHVTVRFAREFSASRGEIEIEIDEVSVDEVTSPERTLVFLRDYGRLLDAEGPAEALVTEIGDALADMLSEPDDFLVDYLIDEIWEAARTEYAIESYYADGGTV